jgi:hypothetical protein
MQADYILSILDAVGPAQFEVGYISITNIHISCYVSLR